MAILYQRLQQPDTEGEPTFDINETAQTRAQKIRELEAEHASLKEQSHAMRNRMTAAASENPSALNPTQKAFIAGIDRIDEKKGSCPSVPAVIRSETEKIKELLACNESLLTDTRTLANTNYGLRDQIRQLQLDKDQLELTKETAEDEVRESDDRVEALEEERAD